MTNKRIDVNIRAFRSTLSLAMSATVAVAIVLCGPPLAASAAASPAPAPHSSTSSGASSQLRETFYVDNATTSHCSDAGSGRTPSAPWCDFANLDGQTLAAGTHVLLKSGDTFTAELGKLYGSGTANDQIVLSSYGSGARPHIQGTGAATDRGVWIQDASYWTIENLQISDVGAGLVLWYSSNGHRGLTIRNIYTSNVRGVFAGVPVQSDLPGMYHSAGILITGSVPVTANQTAVSGIQLSHLEGYNDNDDFDISGFNANSGGQQGFLSTVLGDHSVSGVTLSDSYFHHALSGENFDNLNHMSIVGVRLEGTGYGANHASGTTALFFWSSSTVTVANSILTGEQNTGSPDQTETDLEAFDRDIHFVGDYYGGSAGGGIELLEINGYTDNFQSGHEISDSSFESTGSTATFDVTGNGPSAFDGTATANLYGPSSEVFSTVNGNGGTPGPFPGWIYQQNDATDVIHNAGNDFGSTQGAAGWRDQYLTVGRGNACLPSGGRSSAQWRDLPDFDSTADQWTGRGTISATSLRPADGVGCAVARAWNAPSDGTVALRGRILSDARAGSRESARITLNGKQVWPADGSARTASSGTSDGYSADVNVYVKAGDVLRFEVSNVHANSSAVSWMPSIAYTGPAPIEVNNDDPSVTYSAGWSYQDGLSGYLDADADYSNTPGTTATVKFTGTGITWHGKKASDHGRADVSVCDAQGANCGPVTTVDTYSASSAAKQALYSAAKLTYGEHILKITLDSATSGSDRYVDIDYFTESGTNVNDASATVTYSSGWTYQRGLDGYYDSDAHVSDRVGSTASVAFTGTGITWIGSTADRGRASVAVCQPDGTTCARAATVSPHQALSDTQQPIYTVSGLGDGPHILKITVLLGTAGGAGIDLDAFSVNHSPRLGDNDPSIDYGAGWNYTSKAGYLDDDAHFSAATGATVTVPFTGTGIEWVGGTANDHGQADVAVCDSSGNECGSAKTVDTYSTGAVAQQKLFAVAGLPYGAHTLKIAVLSSSSGTGHYTDVDAFIISG
jgi:hypothetical protein